jgi:hypothetical protein
MSTIVDRRGQSRGKELPSRERFMKRLKQRHKQRVKDAVNKKISEGNITDMGKGGTGITVPRRDTREPHIVHGQGGVTDRAFPGNKQFQQGDILPKPPGGSGRGTQGSPDGEGEDDFVWISEEEFFNVIFEDLELPNLTKQCKDATSDITRPRRAGFTNDGAPNQLDVVRSKKRRMQRLFAAEAPFNRREIELLEEKENILKPYVSMADMADAQISEKGSSEWTSLKITLRNARERVGELEAAAEGLFSEEDNARLAEIEEEIKGIDEARRKVPKWNESTDLRFRFYEQEPVPINKAVMFCLMDVSASMDQETKDRAKLFYVLLYRFLQRHYDQTDIVFIRHTQDAKEVDEKEFFYGKETGGTRVSSALDLMLKTIKDRYPENEWNIYGAQASDGDNWSDDDPICDDLIRKVLEKSQAYFYTEITERGPQGLWNTYEAVAEEYNHFYMGRIESRQDIYPVFREFFKKRNYVESAFRPGQDSAPKLECF